MDLKTDLMKKMDFEEYLRDRKGKIDSLVADFIPKNAASEGGLFEAVRYSVMSGGKRIRPILMGETFGLFFDGKDEEALSLLSIFQAAIEFIHSYSLVHDDLPAMDDDEFRRGKKTTHAEFGEALAILAGDTMLNYAYELVAMALGNSHGDDRVVRAFSALSQKAGILGMTGGQGLDIFLDGYLDKDGISTEEKKKLLLEMISGKTCALFEASMMCGAYLGGASAGEAKDMETLGHYLGLAFQLRDDILDIEQDRKIGKKTYVTVMGEDEATAALGHSLDEALSIIIKYSHMQHSYMQHSCTEFFSAFLSYLKERVM